MEDFDFVKEGFEDKKEKDPPKKGTLLCYFDTITKYLARKIYPKESGGVPEEIKKEIETYKKLKLGKNPLEANNLDDMRQKIGAAFENYKRNHPDPNSQVTKCLEQIGEFFLKKAPKEMFLSTDKNTTDYGATHEIKEKQKRYLLEAYEFFAKTMNKASKIINGFGNVLKNKRQKLEDLCHGDKRKLKKVAKFFNACVDFISIVKKDFEEALDTVVKEVANGEEVNKEKMHEISAFVIDNKPDSEQFMKLALKTYPYLLKMFDTSLFVDMPDFKKEYDAIILGCMQQIKCVLAFDDKEFKEFLEFMQGLGMLSSSQAEDHLKKDDHLKKLVENEKEFNKKNYINFKEDKKSVLKENPLDYKKPVKFPIKKEEDEKFEPIEFIKDFSGIKFDIDKISQTDVNNLKQQLDAKVADLKTQLQDIASRQPDGEQPGEDKAAREKLKEIIGLVNAWNDEQKSYMQQQNQETSEIKQYIQQYEEMLKQSDQTINDLKKEVDEFKKNQNEEEEEEQSESTLDSILSEMAAEDKRQEKEEKEKKEKEEKEQKDKQRKENMMQMMKMMMNSGNNNNMMMMLPFMMQQYGSRKKGNKTMNNLMPLMFMMSQQQSR